MNVGKYQLIRKLASGGMAEVFLAKAEGPMGFEKTLVLKRILPHLSDDPNFVEMFLEEAKLAARLDHPNIVQIFDFGEADDSYFLAMEYIDGPTLRQVMKRASEQEQVMPPALCAKIVASVAEGLAFAHESSDPTSGAPLGLIHRDVSPDNILLSRKGAVKVVDFGIAKVTGQRHQTQAGVVKGKIAYMPPEQLQAKPMDLRVDVYALGVVLYELLTGCRPFDATTDMGMMQAILYEPFVPAVQRRPDLPMALQKVLARVLAKDREERYPDCYTLQEDLEQYVMSVRAPVGAVQIARFVEHLTGDGPRQSVSMPVVELPQALASPVEAAPAPKAMVPVRRRTKDLWMGGEVAQDIEPPREVSMSAPLDPGGGGANEDATVRMDGTQVRPTAPVALLARATLRVRTVQRSSALARMPPPSSQVGEVELTDPDERVPTLPRRVSERDEEDSESEGVATGRSWALPMDWSQRQIQALVAIGAALLVAGYSMMWWASRPDVVEGETSVNGKVRGKFDPSPVTPIQVRRRGVPVDMDPPRR